MNPARPRALRAEGLRAPAWLLLWLALGCSGPQSGKRGDSSPKAAGDQELLSLLPAGLDAVLDVDVVSLRGLGGAADLLGLLPAEARQVLGVFSDEPLMELEALCAGVTGLGTPPLGGVVAVRGRLSQEHLWRRFREEVPGAAPVDYHGVTLLEGRTSAPAPEEAPFAGRSVALLSPRTAVLGGRTAVRQVIDNLQGDGESARTQAPLMAALGKAPRARVGRPAVLLAIVPTPGLRERLREGNLADLGADASYIAAALAVGDGLDLGVVAGYRELPVARDVVEQLQLRLQGLRQRPSLALLGLTRLLDPLVVVAAMGGPGRKEPELHVAYRLPGEELAWFLSRLARFQRVRQGLVPPGSN